MTSLKLDDSLRGAVGQKTAGALERAFGYQTVLDLLWHLPRRYSHRGELTPLKGLPVGEHVTVVAQVLDVTERTMQSRRGSILEVRVTDGTGHLSLTFFNQSWRKKDLRAGVRGQFAGKVSQYRGNLQLQHPDYELFESADIDNETDAQLREAAALAYSRRPVPVYPATSTVPSWVIAKTVGIVLDGLAPVVDPTPKWVRDGAEVIDFETAMRFAHQPETDAQTEQATRALKLHEAYLLEVGLKQKKLRHRADKARPRALGGAGALSRFDAQLPFALTADQQRVGAEIATDLSQSSPMNRLLQGEVGSGKTLVALRAMLQVADSGGQSALLAPTEVLASQHLRAIRTALGEELCRQLQPTLITGKMTQTEKRHALLAIASGQAQLIVGTHALMSDATTFADLGFIVIDEQHRFGVEQREALRQKADGAPHVLAMTATPIPRTVALTAFGDLEISSLRELPAGRQEIQSFAVSVREQPRLDRRAWERLLEEVRAGRQGYVVCPAISPTEAEDGSAAPEGGGKGSANVTEVTRVLKGRTDFAGVRVSSLTGLMPVEEKERVMTAFEAGEIDVLVATTVIEVGVNVPNATMMLVLEADRFGLSQLHQLRGRVGRGAHGGLCLFMTEAPRDTEAWQRVSAAAETLDGFVLAEIDLELRREGDILGTHQSGGKATLKLLRVAQDGELIALAAAWADETLAQDPDLSAHPELRRWILREDARLAGLEKS